MNSQRGNENTLYLVTGGAGFMAGDLRGISVLWKNSSGCLRARKQLSFISPV